jgi:hypothetical protein
MADGPNFVEFIFKVPVASLQGDNKVGTGGVRGADGKMAAQAYDPRPIPQSERAPNLQVGRTVGAGVPPWLAGAIEQAAVRLGALVIEEYAIPAARRLWSEKLSPSARKRRLQQQTDRAGDASERPEVIVALEVSEPEVVDQSDGAVLAPLVHMSREQAQRHAEAARAAFEVFVEHASALRSARIVDDEALVELTRAKAAQLDSSSSVEPPRGRIAESVVVPAETTAATTRSRAEPK